MASEPVVVAFQSLFLLLALTDLGLLVALVHHVLVAQLRRQGSANIGTCMLILVVLANAWDNWMLFIAPFLGEGDALQGLACSAESLRAVFSPLLFVVGVELAATVGPVKNRNARLGLIARSICYSAAALSIFISLGFWARKGWCSYLQVGYVVKGFPSYKNNDITPPSVLIGLGVSVTKLVGWCLVRRLKIWQISPLLSIAVLGILSTRFNAVYGLIGSNFWETFFLVLVYFMTLKVTASRDIPDSTIWPSSGSSEKTLPVVNDYHERAATKRSHGDIPSKDSTTRLSENTNSGKTYPSEVQSKHQDDHDSTISTSHDEATTLSVDDRAPLLQSKDSIPDYSS